MEIYDLLEKDHRKVEELFEKIESGEGNRDQLTEELKHELTIHSKAEEQIFYTALSRNEETRAIIEEGREEHKKVEVLIRQLGDSEDDDFESTLSELKKNVEHHVEEEEGEMFQKARKVLTPDEADDLGEQFEIAKGQRSIQSAAEANMASNPPEVVTAVNPPAAEPPRAKVRSSAKKSGRPRPKKAQASASGSRSKGRATPKKKSPAAKKKSPAVRKGAAPGKKRTAASVKAKGRSGGRATTKAKARTAPRGGASRAGAAKRGASKSKSKARTGATRKTGAKKGSNKSRSKSSKGRSRR